MSLIETLDIGPNSTQVAAIRFSKQVNLEFYLNTYTTKGEVTNALFNLKYDANDTNTVGAMQMARELIFVPNNGDRKNIRNVAILITDGISTVDPARTLPQARLARDSGIIMFVVGVTNEINDDELKGIASTPIQNHYFNSIDISNLHSISNQILRHVCRIDNIESGKARQKGKYIHTGPSHFGLIYL